ncbi:carbohydrate ABC transporter permease [Salinicoccus halodurans]|uniref:ABC transporter permease n=1 Tax=Salinicoccus halodurans TaxID=407035 RepID=A0A0F7HIX9_9STAP|nr:sugar ABC transporter permease [Salinicoccus halodurans]AKG72954.1 ABC transporter permease [Salinicoccus halodurans]SFK76631.1 raffinose/stachyose/melibiose transport system permease protein [Salinicoccus halodurans]
MKTKNPMYWVFLAPVLAALLIVVVVPFIWGIYYSLTEWSGDMAQTPVFKGFDNYANLLSDPTFLNALWFTFKYAIVTVIIINVVGFSLALIVTSYIKSKNMLRTIFFMPNLIGGLILGFIWQFIFTDIFNFIGNAMGVEMLQGWLATPATGFWGMVILHVWQMAGYIMIIYIAYLQSIPDELLEAADMDGASYMQKLKNVILPLVAPAFTVSMFLTLSGAFKIYDQNLSLTGGGPGGSTKMIAMDIVDTAFAMNTMGMAQAKAVVFFIIVAILSLTQVYYNKKKEVEL